MAPADSNLLDCQSFMNARKDNNKTPIAEEGLVNERKEEIGSYRLMHKKNDNLFEKYTHTDVKK